MAVHTLSASPLKQKVRAQQVLKSENRSKQKEPPNPAVVTSVSPDRKPRTEIPDV